MLVRKTLFQQNGQFCVINPSLLRHFHEIKWPSQLNTKSKPPVVCVKFASYTACFR